MKKMPEKLKNKLRQYYNANLKAKTLNDEVRALFCDYGMDLDYFTASANEYEDNNACKRNIQTEALTFIDYCEGDIEENIKDIEEVFVYQYNRKKKVKIK
jgi:hypothetical protein